MIKRTYEYDTSNASRSCVVFTHRSLPRAGRGRPEPARDAGPKPPFASPFSTSESVASLYGTPFVARSDIFDEARPRYILYVAAASGAPSSRLVSVHSFAQSSATGSPGMLVSGASARSHAPPVLPVRCDTQSASFVSSSSLVSMRAWSHSSISSPSTIS